MPLEAGLGALDEGTWELGGLALRVATAGDDGLDDVAELEGEDADGAGDGAIAGDQRLSSRPIDLQLSFEPLTGEVTDEMHSTLAAQIDELRKVVSPLPDRSQTRLLRWRRRGEPAKRIAVRPARGKPLTLPGDWRRLTAAQVTPKLRLEAPDPVILSDEYHTVTFTAGETKIIANAGSFCAVLPGSWWLAADGPVVIENLDHGEYVQFPVGPVTVTRSREIVASSYGLCYGPASTLFPRWPLLRPGDNTIRASAPCTFNWRDTW